MIKIAVIVAIFLPSAAFAAVPVLTFNPQTPSEQSGAATIVFPHGTRGFGQLSMGPDPGGHTGATVTPETSKTGQPSQDAAVAPTPSGATTNNGASRSDTPKQQPESSGKKPSDTTGAPTTSSTAGQSQPAKDR